MKFLFLQPFETGYIDLDRMDSNLEQFSPLRSSMTIMNLFKFFFRSGFIVFVFSCLPENIELWWNFFTISQFHISHFFHYRLFLYFFLVLFYDLYFWHWVSRFWLSFTQLLLTNLECDVISLPKRFASSFTISFLVVVSDLQRCANFRNRFRYKFFHRSLDSLYHLNFIIFLLFSEVKFTNFVLCI